MQVLKNYMDHTKGSRTFYQLRTSKRAKQKVCVLPIFWQMKVIKHRTFPRKVGLRLLDIF
jgi:hypothetical protein